MRKAVLIALLALASGNATAEWARVSGDGASTSYANAATIYREGSMVKMWDMVDYKNVQTPAGRPYHSMASHVEYDCAGKQIRTLTVSMYAGNLAKGNTVSTGRAGATWMPINSGSQIEPLWKFACGKP
jgi:hypothetical protein